MVSVRMVREANQSSSIALFQHILHGTQADGKQNDAQKVNGGGLHAIAGVGEKGEDDEPGNDADGQVDEEDPGPRVVVGDPAAERGADGGRDDDAENVDGLYGSLLFTGKDLAQGGLGGGQQGRASRALHDAPEYQFDQAVWTCRKRTTR